MRLGLTIGQYDADFVDAYYGPDSLKPAAPINNTFPKDSLLSEVNNLIKALNGFEGSTNDTMAKRAIWMQAQLKAFERRMKLFAGDVNYNPTDSSIIFNK